MDLKQVFIGICLLATIVYGGVLAVRCYPLDLQPTEFGEQA